MWKRFDKDGWPPEDSQYIAGNVCHRSHDGSPMWLTEVFDGGEQPDTEEYPFYMVLDPPNAQQIG